MSIERFVGVVKEALEGNMLVKENLKLESLEPKNKQHFVSVVYFYLYLYKKPFYYGRML